MFKKIFCILAIFFCIALIIHFSIRPIVLSLARSQLKKVFKDSSVSIKRCDIDFFNSLAFYGIELKKDGAYDLKIKEVRVYYSLRSLLKREILKVAINDALADVVIGNKNFQIENAFLKLDKAEKGEGEFYIDKIKYNKIILGQIKSKARIIDNTLLMDSMSIDFIGGRLEGALRVILDKSMQYNFKFKALNLNIDTLVNELNLTEKFEMSGNLMGAASLEGRITGIKYIDGSFFTDRSGGVLIIKDNKFLENVAKRSGQSFEVLVESFKNYHYNIGLMKLYMDKGSLILDVKLEGEAGKRNLTVAVHDFN